MRVHFSQRRYCRAAIRASASSFLVGCPGCPFGAARDTKLPVDAALLLG